MIKLTNVEITNNFDTKEEKIFLSKSEIGRMSRDKSENFTNITMKNNRFLSYSVKETPEEILVMPDIEASEKDIDWEQRRYEIAKEILPTIHEIAFEANDYMPSRELIAEDAIKYADALINELKKGGEK